MKNTILIVWDSGSANIGLDAFLPCTKKKFKQFLDLIRLQSYSGKWDPYKSDVREFLLDYLDDRMEREKMAQKDQTHLFWKYNAEYHGWDRKAQTKKNPDGTRLTDVQIGDAKTWRIKYRKMRDECKREAERHGRNIPKLKAHRQAVEVSDVF